MVQCKLPASTYLFSLLILIILIIVLFILIIVLVLPFLVSFGPLHRAPHDAAKHVSQRRFEPVAEHHQHRRHVLIAI